MSAFSTPIQYNFGIPSQSNKKTERNKRIQKGKEKIKLSLFADDMMLYPKDLKNSTKKLLEIINSFCKIARYKINIQKSVAFLKTNNKEIRRKITFAIASKTVKYLGKNLMKERKDLFNEKYKPTKKEIKDYFRRWKDLHVPGLVESTL
jgi:hypothetical protein